MGEVKTRGYAAASTPSQPSSALEAWSAGVASVHPAPAPVVDSRIPGVAPDIKAITPWVDTVPSPQDLAVDMKATANAAALVLARPTTNDPSARWKFLDRLDRIADPILRAKTLEKFQAQTGMPLQVFIQNTEWHGDRDQEQALALISPERGAAERELQGLSPEKRKKLNTDANGWSQQILKAARPDDANDNSATIADVLGTRSAVEIEAIRAAVRHSTQNKSLYQEIDRSQSGGNKDEALAGTTGNPVFAASMGIANANGDAERIKKIVGGLTDAQRAGLVLSSGPLGASAITSSVHESQRGEIHELLTGTRATADGAHFADLFKDPKAGIEFEGMQPTEQSQQSFAARQPENVIKELRSKSLAEIEAARTAWDNENPGRSWDQMIQERFGSGEPTTFLRINALAHGNKVEERAYALREGIRKNNQAQIETALANPDLTSRDLTKRAAAQAEKRQLQDQVLQLDALGQRAIAMMAGQDPAHAGARDVDAQLADHYADAVASNPRTVDPGELLLLSADPDGQRAKRKIRATDDNYATTELATTGSLSTTTQIRRAETKGDTQRKVEILENLPSGTELATVRAEYARRHNKDVLANPDLADIDSNTAFLHSTSGLSSAETRDIVANEMQSSNELKIEHVGRYGVKAERAPHLQHVLQKDVAQKQHSESHEEYEALRARYGLNVGTNDLVQAQLANQSELFATATGPFGTGPRTLRADVSHEDFTQEDNNVTGALDLHRAEKIKHAEHMANTFVTAAKLAALFVGQPGLVLLIDAAANLGGMAIKRSAGGSDVDLSRDMEMMAVDVIADAVPVLARVGAAAHIGPSAARVGQQGAAELGEHAVTHEAKSEVMGAGLAASGTVSRDLAVESGAAQLAKADPGALAIADRKLATDGISAGTTAAGHGGMVTNLSANAFGSVGSSVVHGESSNDNLTALARSVLGMFLPSHFAGSMQKAIGTGSTLQRGFGTAISAGADVGTNAAISGSIVDAAAGRVGHHVGGHSNAHADDARYAPTRVRDDDPNPLAHYADEPARPHHSAPSAGAPSKAQHAADDHKRVLAERIQNLVNADRAKAQATKQDTYAMIDQLAGLATSADDWKFIRELEHGAKRPVSDRYSPHDELAAIQQYERAGGLNHADGTPMTQEEAKEWVAQSKREVQDGIDAKTADHHATVKELTLDLRGRIDHRDAAKTNALATKVRSAPRDDRGQRVVTVNEAISLGMGGAGAAGAKNGHVDNGGAPLTRKDRMGIEDATKRELWGTLGTKAAGQEANAVSYGTDGIRTVDVAEHATAQVAKASELALQVAAQRNDSQIGTIGSNGPIGQLQVKRVRLADGGEVLEVGVPVKMKIDGVEQVVVVTTTKGVDISSGMGQARQLTTDKTAPEGRPHQIQHEYANKLKEDRALMTGEQALASAPGHFEGKRVLGIGGGPTSEWVAEHALHGNAKSVQIVGTMPRPHKDSAQGVALTKLEADIRTLVESGQDVPLGMTQQHQQIVSDHVERQLKQLATVEAQLVAIEAKRKADPEAKVQWEREKALAEQAAIKSNIDPFLGSRVDRNHATLNNSRIKHGQADVMSIRPATGGGVEVVFTDGTRTVVDQVIPSIGVDHDAPGGVDFMLKALLEGVQMIPVIADGRVVGLESDPPGLSISGAALTGSTGLNMPKELLSRVPPNMRDAFMTSVVDHSVREEVSDGSRGIIPGIENVGQNPALMQEVLALAPEERAAKLREFLETHEQKRRIHFDSQPRYQLTNKVP